MTLGSVNGKSRGVCAVVLPFTSARPSGSGRGQASKLLAGPSRIRRYFHRCSRALRIRWVSAGDLPEHPQTRRGRKPDTPKEENRAPRRKTGAVKTWRPADSYAKRQTSTGFAGVRPTCEAFRRKCPHQCERTDVYRCARARMSHVWVISCLISPAVVN